MGNVVVVGAGPAGAGLAYVLAARGIGVTLLERQRDFAREFRGEILMPSGVTALTQMGLGQALAESPQHCPRDFDVYLNQRLLVQGRFQPKSSGEDIVAVSQAALLEHTVAHAATFPAFQLVRGAGVRELLREGDRVVGVHALVDGEEKEFHADLVIGADGRSSTVRKHTQLKPLRSDPPLDIVWCKLPCPEDWTGVRAFAGRGHLLVAYHTWDGTLQLGWVILKGTFGELRERGIEEWVEEMANHVTEDFAEHLRAHVDAVRKPFLLSTAANCSKPWSRPGALLIGDAAHTMSPVGGQGVNIALRDALVAANHLVPILTGTNVSAERVDQACAAIEHERLKEVRPIQQFQAQPPKLLLNRGWYGEPLRGAAGAFLRSAPVKRLASKRTSIFFHGVTKTELTV